MRVVEIFNSIQGEGSYIGYPATFVRVAGCNLHCKFCDTKYALTGGRKMNVAQLWDEIQELKGSCGEIRRIVLTGGEPLLYQDELRAMEGWSFTRVMLETNGTIPPDGIWFRHATVSPKLSGAETGPCDLDVLRTWNAEVNDLVLKFVITRPDEVQEALELVDSIDAGHRIIVFQPDGLREDYALALRELYTWITLYRYSRYYAWRILPQLHRIMWGKNARGV